jgi:hypothetical protein
MVFGKGVNDAPFPVSINGVHIKEYRLWKGMLGRCYAEKAQLSHKTYDKTEVDTRFYSFMYFYNFVRSLTGFDQRGWNLDKDILGDSTVYSPEVIVFVPPEVNMFFVKNLKRKYEGTLGVRYDKRVGRYCSAVKQGGRTINLGYFGTALEAQQAYCKAKEAYAKLLAEKWKYEVDSRVYNRLLEFKVVI